MIEIFKTPDIPVQSCNNRTPILNEDSNSSLGTPFKRALIWPEVKEKTKRRRNVEKIPSVVTSKEWKKFMVQKEEKKEK